MMKNKKLLYDIRYSIPIFIIFLLTTSLVSEAAAPAATPAVTILPKVTAGKISPVNSVTPTTKITPTAQITPSPTPAKTASRAASSPVKTINPVQVREDGLTIVKYDTPKDSAQSMAYLTLVLKTGYAHDPNGKAGLTSLTNELIYYLLQNTTALNSSYYTSADFSYFNFSVPGKDFDGFCKELDDIIRLDALLLYDKCNELIQFYENEPHLPRETGELQLYGLLFGDTHPYFVNLNPDYTKLNINEVNNWFRKIYRPNNIIISSSAKIPADFLRNPSGREMAEPMALDKIPQVNYNTIPTVRFSVIRDNLNSVFIGLPMPRIDEDGFFTASLVQEYLKKILWTKLREELGLCYDVQVSYSYFNQFSTPILMITFQTLPADSSQAVGQTLLVLNNLAKEGIHDDELVQIKDRKKNLNEREEASRKQITQNWAFQTLFNLTWLSNQSEYLKQLNLVTPQRITKLVSDRLRYLKVSVVGPANPDNIIADINLKVMSLTDAVK